MWAVVFNLAFGMVTKGAKGQEGRGNKKNGKKIVSQKTWGWQERIGNLIEFYGAEGGRLF